MTAFKKISIAFLCITLVMLTVLAFTSCGGERLENGILYNGTAVIGADKYAVNLESITFTGDTEIWENIKKSIPQSVISKINVTINTNNS